MDNILSLTIFNGQNIRQVTDSDGNIWMSLTDCANSSGRSRDFLYSLFKSDSYKEYVEALGCHENLTLSENILKVVKSTEETEIFTQGTYLNVSSKSGRSLLLYVAQRISPEFHIWCNKHIENILKEGYSIDQNILAKKEESIERLLKVKKDLTKIKGSYKTLTAKHELLLNNKISSESELSIILLRIFSIVGISYRSEDACVLSDGKVVRFDLLRRQGKLIDIIELKNQPLTYRLVANDLYLKKKYVEAIQQAFPERVVKITFLSPDDNQLSSEDFEDLAIDLPDNIQLAIEKLDFNYFKSLYHKFLFRKIDEGFTYSQADSQWKRSEAPYLISKITE